MAILVDDIALQALAAELGQALTARGWMLTTAESCTGGLIAGTVTAVSGSSRWFERGVVTYSNAAKTELLDVPDALIARHGAVSREVALAMAEGALRRSHADVSLAVTGIAGPDGGSPDKPVGTVWFAYAWRSEGRVSTDAETLRFDGDRTAVRVASVRHALKRILDRTRP